MESSPPPQPGMGMVVQAGDSSDALEMIAMAEQSGVDTVWMTSGPLRPDPLPLMGAASQITDRVRMGTAVVPIWPRHPLALAQQVMSLESLAPGRIRLGLGPSTPAAMSPYRADFRRPLSHLREYLTCLRTLFGEGQVEFAGEFVQAKGRISAPLPTPVLASALGPGAFRLCGEATDGAISWVCPPGYVKDTGLPALQSGAEAMHRAAPPIILCVPTLVSQDPETVGRAARQYIAMYTRFQFYREMFQRAGYHPSDGEMPPALVRDLVVSGSVEQVAARLCDLATWSEVMVFPLTGGWADREGWELCLAAIRKAGEK